MSVAWAHHRHHLHLLLYYGSIDVGIQEFLPVIFYSLVLTNNQKFIAPHVGFNLSAKYSNTRWCLQGVLMKIIYINEQILLKVLNLFVKNWGNKNLYYLSLNLLQSQILIFNNYSPVLSDIWLNTVYVPWANCCLCAYTIGWSLHVIYETWETLCSPYLSQSVCL